MQLRVPPHLQYQDIIERCNLRLKRGHSYGLRGRTEPESPLLRVSSVPDISFRHTQRKTMAEVVSVLEIEVNGLQSSEWS